MSDEMNNSRPQNGGELEQKTAAEPKKGPADTLRRGRIKATIWERSGENGPAFSTTLTRTYTDGEGQPRDSRSFSASDLLEVSELARLAYHRSHDLRRERQQDQTRAPDREGDEVRQQSDRKSAFKFARRVSRSRARRRTGRS